MNKKELEIIVDLYLKEINEAKYWWERKLKATQIDESEAHQSLSWNHYSRATAIIDLLVSMNKLNKTQLKEIKDMSFKYIVGKEI